MHLLHSHSVSVFGDNGLYLKMLHSGVGLHCIALTLYLDAQCCTHFTMLCCLVMFSTVLLCVLSCHVMLCYLVLSCYVRLCCTMSCCIIPQHVELRSLPSVYISDVLGQSVISPHRWGYICIGASESSWSEPAQ